MTPTLRATALGNATGHIDVGAGGQTGVKIFAGRAELETTQGQKITLQQNQAVLIDAAGRAGSTIELPPPPTLIAPAMRSRLTFVPAPDPSARLAWTEVKDGVTYHVALDYNVTQANLLISAALEESGIAGTTHDIKGLNLGRYFWRVAAVNQDGIEGAFSRVSHFSVVEPEARSRRRRLPRPPSRRSRSCCRRSTRCRPGSSTSAAAPLAGATVTVNGTQVKVLPDGSFSEFVRHEGLGELVVRATTEDGQFVEQSRAVTKR